MHDAGAGGSDEQLHRRWLAWADDLCRGGRHVADCVEAQARLKRRDRDRWAAIVRPGLRWPGYLGEGYRVGGLLSVGIVHTAFSTAGLAEDVVVRRAIEAHLAWQDARLDDEGWLRALRAMYWRGLTWPGGWTVAKHHSFYWSALGESVGSVAYVNAMRCQWPGAGPPGGVVADCLASCSLVGLVEVLRPRLVISNSRPAFEQLRRVVPVLYVHQLNGRNLERVQLPSTSGPLMLPPGDRVETAEVLAEGGYRRG